MKTAFLLLNMEIGYCKDILVKLESLEEIKYVFSLYGVYDVLVKIEGDTTEAIKDFIIEKIRTNPDLKSSLTMLVVTGFTFVR